MNLPDFARKHLADAQEHGLKRTLRGVTRLSPRLCAIGGKEYLDFSSNDYMGLSTREELMEGAIAWTRKYGAGSGAARLISGTSDACLELEEKLADWKGFEASLIVGSGYMANLGVVEALARRDSAVFADKLNHNSLNKGCVLSGAKFIRYKHHDLVHLKYFLEKENTPDALLASDTVFSMDGDLAPLDALHRTAQEHKLILYLDDAHGTGVFGKDGKGLTSPENCDLSLSTFSKALGSYGACVSCSREMKDYLVNVCAPFIFSTALPPAVLGAVDAAVKLMKSSELKRSRERLLERSEFVRNALREYGYDTGMSESMVVPVMIGDPSKTLLFSQRLGENGIYALAVRPPTVPQGTARIRLSFNASHTDADLEKMLSVFKKMAGKDDFFRK